MNEGRPRAPFFVRGGGPAPPASPVPAVLTAYTSARVTRRGVYVPFSQGWEDGTLAVFPLLTLLPTPLHDFSVPVAPS